MKDINRMKKLTYAQLERHIYDLEAQFPHTLRNARRDIVNAGDKLHASACIVSITALGGRQITPPFAIRDGLSADCIAALRADIDRHLHKEPKS